MSAEWTKTQYLDLLERVLLDMVRDHDPNMEARANGLHWPIRAETMVSPQHLHFLRQACEDVCDREIPGGFMECGVWRGGACMMMQAVNKCRDRDATIWVCDSFQGLPPPEDEHDMQSDLHMMAALGIPKETVARNFAMYGLLDSNVKLVAGWFNQSMPMLVQEPSFTESGLAVLRADGDYYGSTMDVLTNIYPFLNPGGWFIEDDYFMQVENTHAREAVDDYRAEHGITEPIMRVGMGCAWMKGNT